MFDPMNEGVEALSPLIRDFSELETSMREGRMPDLDPEQRRRARLAIDIFRVGLDMAEEYSEGLRANVAALDGNLEGVPQTIADQSDTQSTEEPAEEQDTHQVAADTVAGLVLDDAEEIKSTDEEAAPQSEVSGEAAVADSVQIDFVQDEESELNTEAQYILQVLKAAGGEELSRGHILESEGYKELKKRSDGAASQAFKAGVDQLLAAGLVQRASRGKYVIVGEEAFLD